MQQYTETPKICKTCKHANDSVTKCIPEDDAITPNDWCRMWRQASDETILIRLKHKEVLMSEEDAEEADSLS